MRPERFARRRFLAGAAALGGAALAGCVVTPYGPYYRPSTATPGARYRGAWCQGVAGPVSVVELPLAPGVTLTARAERNFAERDRPDLPLRLVLAVPAGQPLRFAARDLRIVETGSARPLATAVTVHVYRYATLAADAWIDPARLRPSGAAGTPQKPDAPHGSARVRVTYEAGFTPDRLHVEGITLDHAAGAIKMPAVALARPASKASARDYRSAELHAELLARTADCRRDTPQRACDNIVEHASVSFHAEDAAARFGGRWFVFGDGSAARVEGEVQVEPRRAGRWRLASPEVHVRDASGRVHTARVDRIQVATNDWITLDTPLFAGPVDGRGDAQMTIEASLPAGAPDFEVTLPDLLLGAERVRIAPLRFERRTFDGGIEPFNC